jgi:predicted RNA-binding protein
MGHWPYRRIVRTFNPADAAENKHTPCSFKGRNAFVLFTIEAQEIYKLKPQIIALKFINELGYWDKKFNNLGMNDAADVPFVQLIFFSFFYLC